MAKLKGPLFSLGASGKIAKTFVFFGWKGLNVAREYVIPINPNTDPQKTQRGYLRDAVAAIHAALALADDPLNGTDVMAYSLLGALQPTPRTWFNTIVKGWIDQNVAALEDVIYHAGSAVAGAEKLTVTMQYTLQEHEDAIDITAGYLYYGTSKTALYNKLACTGVELKAGKDITDLEPGTKYFVQYRPTEHVSFLGANSGIYYGTPTA